MESFPTRRMIRERMKAEAQSPPILLDFRISGAFENASVTPLRRLKNRTIRLFYQTTDAGASI